MKIKARDIVAGWPKGTSTSKRHSATEQRFMLAMRMSVAGWNFQSSYAQLISAELGEELLYAMGQDAMTKAYRRRPRLFPRLRSLAQSWRSDAGVIAVCYHVNARNLSCPCAPMYDVAMWGCDGCASVFNVDPRTIA